MPPWGVNRCLSEELSPLPPQGTSLVSRVKSQHGWADAGGERLYPQRSCKAQPAWTAKMGGVLWDWVLRGSQAPLAPCAPCMAMTDNKQSSRPCLRPVTRGSDPEGTRARVVSLREPPEPAEATTEAGAGCRTGRCQSPARRRQAACPRSPPHCSFFWGGGSPVPREHQTPAGSHLACRCGHIRSRNHCGTPSGNVS